MERLGGCEELSVPVPSAVMTHAAATWSLEANWRAQRKTMDDTLAASINSLFDRSWPRTSAVRRATLFQRRLEQPNRNEVV